MNGPGHYALGASAGIVYAQLAPVTWWQGILAIPVAAGVAHGRGVSPDVDQSGIWRGVDWAAPDEALGGGGPMQHRGISHWWGVYAVLTWLWWTTCPRDLAFGLLFAITGAVLAGWWSHLLGDFIVGAAGAGRGPGIPLFPWWCHIGLGRKCGGWTESALTITIPAAAAGWTAWAALGGPDAPWTVVADSVGALM